MNLIPLEQQEYTILPASDGRASFKLSRFFSYYRGRRSIDCHISSQSLLQTRSLTHFRCWNQTIMLRCHNTYMLLKLKAIRGFIVHTYCSSSDTASP